ncbi:MAG: LLM class flavin-dependent oxidoreductase [Actinomycetota bacterium]|jgi:5,10-methylenetetrahydromethanopterin reductase|nr:LLM class flavin-dependent oxidoreductase [Actinomycetota bacterium]MDA8315615.1 LLM class flavin-dependent oxidoreductase [Actinomycetota bacterium]
MTHFGVQLHGTFPMDHYPRLARAVESYAFDELTVHDIVWWRPVWPILALVAEHTERVLVGPDVTHPYLRHPADTAACLAGIDELSGGRAILGLGAGSMLGPLGLAATRPTTAVRETAELIRRLLARDRAAYQGELFTADPQAQFFWEPQRPRVPIFVGTLGPRMVAEAARWADELRPAGIFAPGFFRDLQRRAREAAGWEGYPVGCEVWVSIADDREEARALGRRILAQFLALRVFEPQVAFFEVDPEEVRRVGEAMAEGDVDGAARRISDRTLDTFVASGNARDVIAGLEGLLEAGPSTVTFSGRLGPDPFRAIELLGAQVLPAVSPGCDGG